MLPRTLDSHCSDKPVRFVLEMNDGWFAARGIKPGTKLRGAPFTKERTRRGRHADPASVVRRRRYPKFFSAKSQFTSELRKASTHFGRALR